MSITKIAEIYEKFTLDYLRLEYKNLNWCELGNQGHYSGVSAKKVYEKLNILKHTSLDINGKDGALKIDLGRPILDEFMNKFDVITNYGTIEHVNNQHQAFKNIHDMCKIKGIVIHAFPIIDHWVGHCRYYYSELFVKNIAKILNYFIINLTILDEGCYKIPRNLIMVTYRKEFDNEFIEEDLFYKIKGIEDTHNLEKTGDYSK